MSLHVFLWFIDVCLVEPASINELALIADDLKLGIAETDLKQYHSEWGKNIWPSVYRSCYILKQRNHGLNRSELQRASLHVLIGKPSSRYVRDSNANWPIFAFFYLEGHTTPNEYNYYNHNPCYNYCYIVKQIDVHVMGMFIFCGYCRMGERFSSFLWQTERYTRSQHSSFLSQNSRCQTTKKR